MVKRSLNFAFLWCWVVGVTGSIVLLVVLNPLENVLLEAEYSRTSVNWIFSGLIVFWLVAASAFSRWLDHRLRGRWPRSITHVVGFTLTVVIFLFFVLGSSGPFSVFKGKTETIAERFEFGPYPDEDRIVQLKKRGFDGIITLLSPSIPFENILLQRERKRASRLGIDLVETPMLPWISSNVDSIGKIRQLVQSTNGQYYVHCYLGKHRVSLARQTILDAVGIEIDSDRKTLPAKLERGAVTVIAPDLALGPLPTPEEWWKLTRARTKRVISLLDPESDYGQSQTALESLVKAKLFDYESIPVSTIQDARRVVDALEAGSGRTYVTGFRGTDWRLELVRGVLESRGKTDRPALGTVPDRLERGSVHQVQPGVYAGPLPTEDEFRSKLVLAGVKTVVNLMDPSRASARERIQQERTWAETYGVKFVHVGPDDYEQFDRSSVFSGTPVYLHDFNRGELLSTFLKRHGEEEPRGSE